jgi:GT2 family glycosyltransferase
MVAGKSWGFDIIKKECYLAFENDMFPLSLSRNIGARIATGDIIGFLDCDVIADPMTLSGVFQTVTVSESAALSIVYRMPHIPDHEIYRYLDVNSFRKNRTIGTLEIKGRGGCFFIDRELLFRIRGYDERLVGWGYEDDDMMIRLYRMGKYPYNMSKLDIIAMHQHHATAANAKHTWRMNHRVSAVSLDVVRNPRTWGGEPG